MAFINFKKKYVLAALTVCCLLSMVLLLIKLNKTELSFPPLPYGYYAGVIHQFPVKVSPVEVSSFDKDKETKSKELLPRKDVTFFIKREKGTNLATLVLFIEGWAPKIVELKRLESDVLINSDDIRTNKLNPVKFIHAGETYTLFGRMEEGQARGFIRTSQGEAMPWELSLLSSSYYNGSLPADEETYLELKKWLELKSVYRDFQLQINGGEEIKSEQEKRLAKIEKYFRNEELLKQLATQKENEIKEEIILVNQSKENNKQQIKDLIRQLHILARVKERGKIVRSLRRLSARESSWYRANWKEKTAASRVLRHIAGSGISSMRELETQYKEALEVQYIKNQIRKEKVQIRELKEEIESFMNESGPEPASNKPQLSNDSNENKEPVV